MRGKSGSLSFQEQQFAGVLDPTGFAFYRCGQKKRGPLFSSLSVVHASRLARKGPHALQLMHGPQDLCCEFYAEVLQLFKLLGRGEDLASALGRVAGMRPGNYFSHEKGAKLVETVSQDYGKANGCSREFTQPYETEARERVWRRSEERPEVNPTPLPRELTHEERRRIWLPPNTRR